MDFIHSPCTITFTFIIISVLIIMVNSFWMCWGADGSSRHERPLRRLLQLLLSFCSALKSSEGGTGHGPLSVLLSRSTLPSSRERSRHEVHRRGMGLWPVPGCGPVLPIFPLCRSWSISRTSPGSYTESVCMSSEPKIKTDKKVYTFLYFSFFFFYTIMSTYLLR